MASLKEKVLSEFKKLNKSERPKILFCTPEITQLPEEFGIGASLIKAKTGGLADISAGLIKGLYEDGKFEVHLAIPKYDSRIKKDLGEFSESELGQLKKNLEDKYIHLIDDSAFSHVKVHGDNVYPYSANETHKEIRLAEAFQRYVINYILDDIRPDIVHCNDWMTGLIPAAAKIKGIKSLFTAHNIFSKKDFLINLHKSGIDMKKLKNNIYFEKHPKKDYPKNTEMSEREWNWRYNPVDLTASGIFAADYFNTVSPNFLKEIIDGYFKDIISGSIRDVVKKKYDQKRAIGILNGPNDNIDPKKSPNIYNYNINNFVEGKKINKLKFQKETGLIENPDIPLILWPHRLANQKGIDLVMEFTRRCLHDGYKFKEKIQLAFIGNGDNKDIEDKLGGYSIASNGYICRKPFVESLADLGRAGADFMLQPSIYEPCGIPPMECPKYGTLSIAREIGGLKDIVKELDAVNGTGNGFLFGEFNFYNLENAIEKAVNFYNSEKTLKEKNIQRIMRNSYKEFKIDKTIKQYTDLYSKIIAGEDLF